MTESNERDCCCDCETCECKCRGDSNRVRVIETAEAFEDRFLQIARKLLTRTKRS